MAAGGPIGTHSSGASLYVLNGLQAMSLKSEDHLHQSRSSSKDQSRVSVCPRPPLSGEGQRQGRRAGDQLGVEELWEARWMQAGTAAWSCHLILKFSKVQRLQGRIYFLSLSFILLQPPCSNNLPQATASFACAESWPNLHHLALGCFHSPLL